MESLEFALGRKRALAAPSPPPTRFVGYFVPNGIRMQKFTPATEGPGFDLPPTLEPLLPLQDRLLVLSGLSNLPGVPEGAGDHAAGTGAFLTAAFPKKTEGEDLSVGVSVDQRIAQGIGAATRFPSLELGLEGGSSTGGCDFGYSCAYIRNVSWTSPSTPAPKMVNPQVVFDRLFAGQDPSLTEAEIALRRKHRLSVLDHVLAEAESLSPKLAKADRLKLGQFMDAVRDLELQIEALSSAPVCEPPGYPAPGLDIPSHAKVMHELLVLALRCDLTRVLTFMLANGFSDRHYAFLGVSGGHHQLSHHGEKPEDVAQLETIDRWEVELLASLAAGLDAVDEGEGTLLDHTLLYWSSELSDGNTHGHEGMPVLLLGKAGGKVSPGRHVVYDPPRPVADLYTAFLEVFEVAGPEGELFGDDATGPLPSLG
jgi:hypothetical protein